MWALPVPTSLSLFLQEQPLPLPKLGFVVVLLISVVVRKIPEILPGISFAVLVVALLGTDVTVPRYINTSSKYLACVLEFGNYGVVAVEVVAAKLSGDNGAFSTVAESGGFGGRRQDR